MSRVATFTLDKNRSFFDRNIVKARLDKAAYRVFSRLGANIRQTARKSMKKVGKARSKPGKQGSKSQQKWMAEVMDRPPSAPGSPPHCHSDNENASLRKVLYGWDETSQSVVAGPVLLNSAKKTNPTVPELHEEGGTVQIDEVEIMPNVWQRTTSQPASDGRKRRRRVARYPKRPFMQPAFDKEIRKLPQMWENALAKYK